MWSSLESIGENSPWDSLDETICIIWCVSPTITIELLNLFPSESARFYFERLHLVSCFNTKVTWTLNLSSQKYCRTLLLIARALHDLGSGFHLLFWCCNDKHWLLLAKVVGHHCTSAHWQMHNVICSLKIFSIKFIIWQVMVSASPFVGKLLSESLV